MCTIDRHGVGKQVAFRTTERGSRAWVRVSGTVVRHYEDGNGGLVDVKLADGRIVTTTCASV